MIYFLGIKDMLLGFCHASKDICVYIFIFTRVLDPCFKSSLCPANIYYFKTTIETRKGDARYIQS